MNLSGNSSHTFPPRKRLKSEANDTTTTTFVARQSLSSGVERIAPCPIDCHPTFSSHFADNRKLFVDRTRIRLKEEGKNVVKVTFLDDGVTIDWICEKQVVSGEKQVPSTQATLGPMKNEHTFKFKSTDIPGPSKYDNGNKPHVTMDQASCSEDNDDDDDDDILSVNLDSEPSRQQKTKAPSSLNSTKDKPASCSSTGPVDTSRKYSNFPRNSNVFSHASSSWKQDGMSEDLSQWRWKYWRSIIVVKNLARDTKTVDVYEFLLKNGGDVCTTSESKILTQTGHRTVTAYIKFSSPSQAQKIMPCLRKYENNPSRSRVLPRTNEPIVEWCQRPSRNRIHPLSFPKSSRMPVTNYIQCRDDQDGTDLHREASSNPSLRATTMSSLSDSGTKCLMSRKRMRVISASPASNGSSKPVAKTESSGEDSSNETDSSDFSDEVSCLEQEVTGNTTSVGRRGRAGRSKAIFNIETASTWKSTYTQLPKVRYGRARRLLLPSTPLSPLMAVTMRGDVQFIDKARRSRLAQMSLPADGTDLGSVEDACIIEDSAILGYSNSNKQISIVSHAEEGRNLRRTSDLLCLPHQGKGTSTLAPFADSVMRTSQAAGTSNTLGFLSGGYDRTVWVWSVQQNNNREAKVQQIGVINSKVDAIVQLAPTRVLAGARRSLHVIDLERIDVKQRPFRISNDIIHLHYFRNENLFAAEVDHQHGQMQIYDIRAATPLRKKPVIEFGHTDTSKGDPKGVHSRRRRGCISADGTYFVRGYHDGKLFRWDIRKIRNTNREEMIASCGIPIQHTIFADRRPNKIWAYAGETVTLYEKD